MINAISIALSGLNAASSRLNASATNIANAFTENYTPLDTTSKTDKAGGVQTTLIPRIADENNGFSADISLSEEIIDLKVAELAYKANLKTINVAGDLFDELINVFDDE